MIKLSILLLVAVVTVCSGRYLPKKEFVKQTSTEWTDTAKKIGLTDEQTTAVISVMQFIQEHDFGSAEMGDDKQQLMVEKCEKLADKIDELDEYVGDKKWSDVKDEDLSEKLKFWNEKYETWTCEHKKMKAIKNICSLITEDARKKVYLERAKSAGIQDEQLKAMVDAMWDMKIAKQVGAAKAKLADRCEILGGDGKILAIDEKHMANMKWSDVADKNITMQMDFWMNVTRDSDCKIAKVKALKNVCVEFMCPVERGSIEDVVKEAGLTGEDIAAAIDLEMRMLFTQGGREQSEMLMESYKNLGKDKQILTMEMTEADKEKWAKLENVLDFIPKVHFWAKKYNQSTGVDHIKALKNMCSVIVKDFEKYAEHDKEMKERQAAQAHSN